MALFMQLLKSRTVWFAILLAIAGVLQPLVVNLPMSPLAQAGASMVLAVLIVVLRIATTIPVSEK